MVSNRVKRNISGTLLVVGILCVIARGWNLATNPTSGYAWFKTGGMAQVGGTVARPGARGGDATVPLPPTAKAKAMVTYHPGHGVFKLHKDGGFAW